MSSRQHGYDERGPRRDRSRSRERPERNDRYDPNARATSPPRGGRDRDFGAPRDRMSGPASSGPRDFDRGRERHWDPETSNAGRFGERTNFVDHDRSRGARPPISRGDEDLRASLLGGPLPPPAPASDGFQMRAPPGHVANASAAPPLPPMPSGMRKSAMPPPPSSSMAAVADDRFVDDEDDSDDGAAAAAAAGSGAGEDMDGVPLAPPPPPPFPDSGYAHPGSASSSSAAASAAGPALDVPEGVDEDDFMAQMMGFGAFGTTRASTWRTTIRLLRGARPPSRC